MHCFSHKLNLAIDEACDVITIRNVMGIISQVAKFFDNSPKRQEALREKSTEQVQPSKKNPPPPALLVSDTMDLSTRSLRTSVSMICMKYVAFQRRLEQGHRRRYI